MRSFRYCCSSFAIVSLWLTSTTIAIAGLSTFTIEALGMSRVLAGFQGTLCNLALMWPVSVNGERLSETTRSFRERSDITLLVHGTFSTSYHYNSRYHVTVLYGVGNCWLLSPVFTANGIIFNHLKLGVITRLHFECSAPYRPNHHFWSSSSSVNSATS